MPIEYEQRPQFVQEWLVIGPFRTAEGSAEITDDFLGGESSVLPTTGLRRGAYITWKPASIREDGRCVLPLEGWQFSTYAIAYAHVYVHSPEEMEARLVLGSDDGVMAYLNGETVVLNDANRAWCASHDRALVRLREGWNRLLLKVRNCFGRWEFSAMFQDFHGCVLPMLEYQLDNPDPAGRFGLLSRYADLELMLIEPASAEDGIVADLAATNLGDYPAAGITFSLPDGEVCSVESLEGAELLRRKVRFSHDRLQALLGGPGLIAQWQTGSEFRRSPVKIVRPMDWLAALDEAGIQPYTHADIRAFRDRCRLMTTLPVWGPKVREAARSILAAGMASPYEAVRLAQSGQALREEMEAEKDAYGIHVVGHTHLDVAWRMPFLQTFSTECEWILRSALGALGRHPELCYTQNQMALMEEVERCDPDLFQQIAKRVREGQWEVIGGFWVECDTNLPSGESLARQLLFGQRYALEKFGVRSRTAWNVDAYGHSAMLPQLLQKAGIENYVFNRCKPGYAAFWWESPEGSRVLAVEYRSESLPDDLLEDCIRIRQSSGLNDRLFVFGLRDKPDLDRAFEQGAARIRRLQAESMYPPVKCSSSQDYMDAVRASETSLPVVQRSLNYMWRGAWTSQARMKKLNRELENRLYSAEALSAMASLPGQAWAAEPYPSDQIRRAWNCLLLNQFQDIICGTGSREVHEEAQTRFEEGLAGAGEVVEHSMLALTRSPEAAALPVEVRERAPVGQQRFAVFNTLGWERTDPVVVEADVAPQWQSVCAVDESRHRTPVQIIGRAEDGRARVMFVATNVPPVGCKVYTIRKGKAHSKLHVTENRIDHADMSVEIEPNWGAISDLSLRGKQLLRGRSSTLRMHGDSAPEMSAFDFQLLPGKELPELESLELVETGPVRAQFVAKTRFRNSSFTRRLSVYNRISRVDCELDANWQERDTLCVAHFLTRDPVDEFIREIPYGWEVTPADGNEYPALNWVDLPMPGGGVAILNNGRHGFRCQQGRMWMSVLRGPHDPDPESDRGLHNVSWSLVPHLRDFLKTGVNRLARAFNCPLTAQELGPGDIAPGMPGGLLRVSPGSVDLTCLKQAESGEGVVIRVYETHGKAADAEITFALPLGEVQETDIAEIDHWPASFSSDTLTFTIQPFEIRTFHVRFAGG